jgi:starch synthase
LEETGILKIAILTNEYPPHVYGGAGVHVDFLSRELIRLDGGKHEVHIFCFGDQHRKEKNLLIEGFNPQFSFPCKDPRHEKVFDALLRDLLMTGALTEADIIHCHTWYTQFAGVLLKTLWGKPLVLTTHSLEPHRPWKEDQLGEAYRISNWVERTAYQQADGVIAVSGQMKKDVQSLYGIGAAKIQVIANGIDLDLYKPTPNRETLRRYGIDPKVPFLLFVGRISRQKGILHLIRAIPDIRPGIQLVFFAGPPDTEAIAREVEEKLEEVRSGLSHPIVWVPRFVSPGDLIHIYSQASIFVCPSVYEPFGIINLEAMACETPVVASAVGGIPEVVVPGETGVLVPLEPTGPDNSEPKEPERFARDLAEAINGLLQSPEALREMGRRGRKRVKECFSWKAVASRTMDFYRDVIARTNFCAGENQG